GCRRRPDTRGRPRPGPRPPAPDVPDRRGVPRLLARPPGIARGLERRHRGLSALRPRTGIRRWPQVQGLRGRSARRRSAERHRRRRRGRRPARAHVSGEPAARHARTAQPARAAPSRLRRRPVAARAFPVRRRSGRRHQPLHDLLRRTGSEGRGREGDGRGMRRVLAVAVVVVSAAALLGLAVAPARAGMGAGTFTKHTWPAPGAPGARDYWVYVPPGGTVAGRPLVVFLHGCTETASDAALATKFNDLADQRGFVVAYPQQAAFTSSGTGVDGNGAGC